MGHATSAARGPGRDWDAPGGEGDSYEARWSRDPDTSRVGFYHGSVLTCSMMTIDERMCYYYYYYYNIEYLDIVHYNPMLCLSGVFSLSLSNFTVARQRYSDLYSDFGVSVR